MDGKEPANVHVGDSHSLQEQVVKVSLVTSNKSKKISRTKYKNHPKRYLSGNERWKNYPSYAKELSVLADCGSTNLGCPPIPYRGSSVGTYRKIYKRFNIS